MRFLPTCLILLVAGPIGAMDVYRWVDADGVVHFSDQPLPGSQKVPLKPAQKPGSVVQTFTPPAAATGEGARPPPPFRYVSCAIANPAQDEVFNNTDPIAVGLEFYPDYRPGDRIQVSMNGERVPDWPETSTRFTLTNLPRGSYSLTVTVLSPDGELMCTATPVGFHVRQPSLLSPGRKLAPH